VKHILVLNGPNLNLLGSREPTKYGSETLADVSSRLDQQAATLRLRLSHFQSNAEHALIDRIHLASSDNIDHIIINPGGLTHSSVSLRDAFLSVAVSFTEVHISNIYARESFRHHSYLSDIAVGVISGLGTQGYELALAAAAHRLSLSSTD